MGWMYMLVCTMDFVVFPILWSIIQAVGGGRVETQWNPITLQGAGLFHMAMGAVLGVTAWSRGQEKMAGVLNGGFTQTTSPSLSAPTPAASNEFGTSRPASTSGISTSGFGSSSGPTTVPNTKQVVPIGPQPEL